MEADFMIVANDLDITAAVRMRFLKLTIQDSAGEDSDTLTLELDNRDDLIRLPPTGAELKVYIGEPGALVFKGAYQVDELEEPLDDQALIIHAKAAKMLGGIKAPRDATFDAVTLVALVEQMAEKHGYTPAVSPALAEHVFAHIDQRGESDMNLLTRLARDLGAVAKPVGGRLVVVPKGEAATVSGQPLPVVPIVDPHNSSGRVSIQERSDYQSALAYWFSEAEQRKVAVLAQVQGDEVVAQEQQAGPEQEQGPRYVMRKTYTDEQAAREAAIAKLKQLRRGKATMSITRPLTPSIVAEGRLAVSNHRTSANRLWQVESVTHVIGSGEVAYSSAECVTPA